MIDQDINRTLYGYEKLFNLFMRLNNENRMPNKFVISGKKGIGKSTFAYHLINYFFSIKEENKYDLKNYSIYEENKSYNLVKNLTHPNFFLIDLDYGKKKIDIEKIRKAINFSNKSSFNSEKKFILIDNIEFLSLSSANALLKIIEEPNDDLVFVIIHNSYYKIMDTIKSRCIYFNINLSRAECIDCFEKISNEKFSSIFNKNFENNYFSVSDYLNLRNIAINEQLNLKDTNYFELIKYFLSFKTKNLSDFSLMIKLIQIYYRQNLLSNFSINKYDELSNLFKKANDAKKFNLNLENLFLEIEKKI
tara:strand:- start:2 stop:919 length:918 start_codon:yes stop_codon:yes gene_type:complete